jgi:hypothetical protein
MAARTFKARTRGKKSDQSQVFVLVVSVANIYIFCFCSKIEEETKSEGGRARPTTPFDKGANH